MRTTITLREKMEIGTALELLMSENKAEGCGWDALPTFIKEVTGKDFTKSNCRSVARAMAVESYFKASRSTQPRVDSRVTQLESQVANILERLEICERKWLQHLQEQQSTEGRKSHLCQVIEKQSPQKQST